MLKKSVCGFNIKAQVVSKFQPELTAQPIPNIITFYITIMFRFYNSYFAKLITSNKIHTNIAIPIVVTFKSKRIKKEINGCTSCS